MTETSKAIDNIHVLLASLKPLIIPGTWVFVSFPPDQDVPKGLQPLASFWETEGISMVLAIESATARGLAFTGSFACITLTVQSSLMAVGLTAAVATCLAKHDISANVIAAFHHDHIFVPVEKARAALHALQELSSQAASSTPPGND